MFGCHNVTLSLDNSTILQDLTFAIPSCGITGLSAPSGVGKTTLLRLLAGCIPPDSGTISVPTSLAIMFQENRLLPWRTVAQHISDVLPRSHYHEVSQWLSLVDLSEIAHDYPRSLSGGMGKRLSFARTMALGGDLVLLDEPFAGIDAPRISKLMAFLRSLDVPVVISSHDSNVLSQCDQVFVLNGCPVSEITRNFP